MEFKIEKSDNYTDIYNNFTEAQATLFHMISGIDEMPWGAGKDYGDALIKAMELYNLDSLDEYLDFFKRIGEFAGLIMYNPNSKRVVDNRKVSELIADYNGVMDQVKAELKKVDELKAYYERAIDQSGTTLRTESKDNKSNKINGSMMEDKSKLTDTYNKLCEEEKYIFHQIFVSIDSPYLIHGEEEIERVKKIIDFYGLESFEDYRDFQKSAMQIHDKVLLANRN